ncbi:MAG: hypothetical protein E6G60_13375 [Actinobacteria bacterium]|nr:MAG: hypothetical protein E6G60_13375 [Actinomycetota bacterium]
MRPIAARTASDVSAGDRYRGNPPKSPAAIVTTMNGMRSGQTRRRRRRNAMALATAIGASSQSMALAHHVAHVGRPSRAANWAVCDRRNTENTRPSRAPTTAGQRSE